MFFKNFKLDLLWFIAIILNQQGAAGFFVKHVKTGKCINDTGEKQSSGPKWGYLTFLQFSNNCLDKTAQFRFRDNGALLNLKRDGCFAAYKKDISGSLFDMFFIYVDAIDKDRSACAQKPDNKPTPIRRAITQTLEGALSVYEKLYKDNKWRTWCAVPRSHSKISKIGIDPYLGLTTTCNGAETRFNFGSVTCHGEMVKYANCPKNQYMVVKTASYRGLPATKTCGLSDDYSCEVDATCLVKKQCDGQHECNITVDGNLFSGDPCPGLTKYLYFEYQCVNTAKSFNKPCVESVSLSSSTSPNKGFLTVSIDNRENTVCNKAPIAKTMNIVCRQLGYWKTQEISSAVSISKLEKFSGSINCEGKEATLSQCVTKHFNTDCSKQSYITCAVCANPLLEYEDYFPDSSFKASASQPGHHPSMARISSGSSWCASISGDKHYLQVDLGGLYVLSDVTTFGDSTTGKWVTSYHLNYAVDMKQWKQALTNKQKIFCGNKNAYNYAVIQRVDNDITVRALRFIPLDSVVQACMRVQICGQSILPGRPYNLTVGKIMSKSAEISWLDPVIRTITPVSRFWIRLKKGNDLVYNLTKGNIGGNKFSLNTLTPFTKYEMSVALGNVNGFGEDSSVMFTTGEAAPEGSPQSVTLIAESSLSLSVTWEPPEKDKRNGIIVSYTVCISHEESKPCFEKHTTKEKMLVIDNLNASTKYYVRVLASTKVGRGPYNESKGFTYGKPVEKAINRTSSTLTFSLHTPATNFTYFYVLALKLLDGEKPKSPDRYQNSELVTYAEARRSIDQKPYIATVVHASSGVGRNIFVLGDGRNTSDPTSRRRRSTASDYYNGPLEPGSSYKVFQRIFIGKGEYYSTEWSPASQTSPSPEVKKPSSGNSSNVGVIVGAVTGILLVLLIIILAIIFYRRRTDKQGSKTTDKKNNIPDNQNESIYNVAFEPPGHQTTDGGANHYQNVSPSECDKANLYTNDDENLYGNQETIVARTHNPIPVDDFDDYVSGMKKNKNKEFTLDFEDLPTGQTLNWDIAKRPYNIPKNRFGNAVTYNHSRVLLSGDEKKDYINASFIDGITEKYYIATQGPKPKTVNDFWQMIFEYKCPTIVMLTTLKEMGKVKCEKYWPDECDSYGEIKVTVTKSRAFADYVTRTFLVEKDNHQLEVQHFHFVSWPDYGVPLYPTQILTFRRHFKSFHETKTGPAVIHCSAGIGRTGVFIAVDKILDDLDKEKRDSIDIFGVVKDMRTRRVNMVQTAEQYVFIHDTILDHTKCGTNEIEASQLMIEIKQLSAKNKKGKTGFEEKFKRLSSVSPKLAKEHCEAALLPENRKKNRNAEIYPSESGRVYLQHMEGVENSDYINACYVDGYLGKNYFIATQTPLEETINDFWRMVFQHNSSTIVMLNQLREGKEYPMFWPTQRAKPQSFGPSTVMLDSFVKKENIVIRKFVVSPSPDLKEGRMMRMIQYMSWPDHGVPKDVDDIVKILSEVEDSQRAAEKKGPVIVICSDGAGRSGTYIAISNLVDRVKVVQVIDVFQCIKLIRTNRPQFVETVAQFKLCYDAITSVLKSFNEYSNFNVTDE